MSEENHVSRRDFISGAGVALAAGALTLASCGSEPEAVVQDCPQPEPCPECDPCPECEAAAAETIEVAMEVPPLPWPYTKLDTENVRKKAHKIYYEAHCAEGAFRGIMSELKEQIGFPYTQLPENLFIYGKGGVVGWANLCGAVNGASAAINLVTGDKDGTPLVDELLSWYTQAELPTDISNESGWTGQFLVEETHSHEVLPKSVAGSILCHASVTNWCKASGIASGAPERSERCGRLCGDTAAKAVEILNDFHAGSFVDAFQIPAAETGCRTCHSKGKDYELGQFTRGKMDCLVCHDSHD